MAKHKKQTTPATDKNKRQREKYNEIKDSITPLSTTMKEAKISKKSRLSENSNPKPNQAILKMAKRLESIAALLVSLPKPLADQTSLLASNLLSKAIEWIHCKRRLKFHVNTPSFLPTSIRFKYGLTCKAEYEDSDTFEALATQSAKIMDETKASQRALMIEVMEMELEGAKTKLQTELIKDAVKAAQNNS